MTFIKNWLKSLLWEDIKSYINLTNQEVFNNKAEEAVDKYIEDEVDWGDVVRDAANDAVANEVRDYNFEEHVGGAIDEWLGDSSAESTIQSAIESHLDQDNDSSRLLYESVHERVKTELVEAFDKNTALQEYIDRTVQSRLNEHSLNSDAGIKRLALGLIALLQKAIR